MRDSSSYPGSTCFNAKCGTVYTGRAPAWASAPVLLEPAPITRAADRYAHLPGGRLQRRRTDPRDADAFNLFNHPSLGNPGTTSLTGSAGQITDPVSLQNNVPDARFFQLAAKYVF